MTGHDLRRAFRRFWALTLAVVVGFLVIGAVLSFVPKSKYESSTLLFAQPTSSQALADGSTTVFTLFLPAIVQQVGTSRFISQVAVNDPSVRQATVTASTTAGTAVLTVTAESTDPQTAARAANAAAGVIVATPISSQIKVSVINPAFAASSPSSPKKGEILGGCLVLGLILGLLAALIADGLRKRISGAEMIRDTFGLTVVGEIARTRSSHLRPVELFLADNDQIEIREDYQRLRTTFELLARDCRTVAISSWAQGEGKTTVATNLAWSLASLGREVTLVDFDLRRPSVHGRLDLDVRGGVGELGTPPGERGGPRRTVREDEPGPTVPVIPRLKRTRLPSLTVLTAGKPVPQPARAIERAFPLIRDGLEDRLVLIDTPPLLAAETAMIASVVDALVIVIDMQRRQPSDLQAMIHVLRLAQTRILGVVLNRVDSTTREQQPPGYYYASPAALPEGGGAISRAVD